ncbi:hypothetical protein [Halomicrococcus gelatinilyticus]|uniref:hypothetical protein n=1 Tax=Halomicrococcus gelatinilyticus TaxID=1702103 RepID=UPI002E0EA7CB
MRRRRLIALLGAGALAGCVGQLREGADGPTDSTTPGGTDDGTTTGTTTDGTTTGTTTDGTTTDEPPADDPVPVEQSRFEGEPCPAFVDDTTCYHALDTGVHETAYVVPGDEVLARPSDSTTFTLYNGGDESVGMNPFAWTVAKRVDDGWAYVAPHVVPQPYTHVEPGTRFTWQFGIGDADVEEDAMGSRARVEHLGPGVYAFAHAGALALFEVTGDTLALDAPDVAATERDGDVLTVRTAKAEGADSPETLVLERASPDSTPATLVTEQAIQSYALRNGLPYLTETDVSTVRVETDGVGMVQTILAAAYRDPTTENEAPPKAERVYDYAGTVFRATVED